MFPMAQTRRNRTILLATGQVTQYSSELDAGYYQKGVIKSYTALTAGQYSGTVNVDLTHLAANTLVSFVTATKEIDCTGAMGVFKSTGGETIVVSGSVSNNGVFTTKATGTANKILVNEAIVTEGAGASVTIKKREAISNNCVFDNNTGLMWARYTSILQGQNGDGKMPWTGFPFDLFAGCAAINSVSLGGYADWRIPNVYELMSIADFEAATALPDATAFPSWTGTFWTSTTKVSNTSNAFGFSFANGIGMDAAKTTLYLLAPVRG